MNIDKDILNMWCRVKENGVEINWVVEAVREMKNKGYDVSSAKKLIPLAEISYKRRQTGRLLKIISMINEQLRKASQSEAHHRKCPTWQEIRQSFRENKCRLRYDYNINNSKYYEKVLGGWYGKLIGVALGDFISGLTSYEIRKKYGEVTYYIEEPNTKNDDTAFPLVVLHTVEKKGSGFSSKDLAFEWAEHIPLNITFTAETKALENIIRGIMPPFSAIENNPFSHWIGAQMRGEIHGLINPGKPEKAAQLAYKDAIISHETEAIYSEIFNSVLVSLSFVETDIKNQIRSALCFVPQNSEFYNIINTTLNWCKDLKNWHQVIDKIEGTLGKKYHWIHTFPNIAIVITSLLFGEGNFDKSLYIAVNSGMDADCTAGQVGATLGVLMGSQKIPLKWKEPLNDQLLTEVRGFERLKISDLATWTCNIAKKINC